MEKWKLRGLRAESDSEEQRVTRTISWDTKMLVQFQTQPQTLSCTIYLEPQQTSGKGDKRGQNLPSQGRPSCDYEA